MGSNSKNLFESMTRRRVSCPQVTQQLWDAIKSVRNQRQLPTSERIQKVMQKQFCVSEEEVTRQLNHCVRDGLIEVTTRTINKGNNAGSEQEWYKLPTLKLKTDEYDWYCFDCHSAGDVICCSRKGCQKVYHLACISSSESPQGAFICHVCKMCEPSPSKFQMKRSKMNRLLAYCLQKLKSRYPLCLRDLRLPPPNKSLLVSDRVAQALTPPLVPAHDESEAWRTYLLVARDMNLTLVEEKIDRHRYRLLEEFHADCLNIVHNMVIYNGVDSAIADIARQMMRDCIEDLQEIRQCADCYKLSHGDKKKLWFCRPCRKPHELVYAKQPGLPYWPAKVIKMEGDQYDVKFFGAQHLRALIPRAHIRPISVNIHTLQVKRSSAWNRACEELKKHQELLEKFRIETRDFTVFQESSSSSESESVDSETERTLEKELRTARVRNIIDKQTAANIKIKQKVKRRRSSSSMRQTPLIEKKRGRPRLSDTPSGGSTNNRNARTVRKRKEIYDSSDSLDSFPISNDNAPKKNTDELFNELLKSETAMPPNTNNARKSPPRDDDKAKKSSETSRSPRKPRAKSKIIPEKKGDLSEGSKTKSDTLDSSTMSSVDTEITARRKRIIPDKNKVYTSTDESDSDSDPESSSSARRKPPSRRAPRKPKKKISPPTVPADKDKLTATDDDSTSSVSDSDVPKRTIDSNNVVDSSSTSSDSDDDSKLKSKLPARKGTAKQAGKPAPAKTKEKGSDSEGSETKTKDSSDSSLDTPPPQRRIPARNASTRGRPKGAVEKQLPQRASQRNINKSEKKSDETKSDRKPSPERLDEDSTDSEAPLSAKTDTKDSIRGTIKKYEQEDSRQNDSSDSDSKSPRIKHESDSESDDDSKNKLNAPKPKIDLLEEKSQKSKKKITVDDKKNNRNKRCNEESKEKEETIVSSSSQEPITRSVAVQTATLPSLSPDIKHRADRISELEKELQIQAQANRLLEMEYDKVKVMLDRMRSEHDDEVTELNSRHNVQISEIKKKQWCYNCETEAIYHCCWNTAYCSVECQQAHWQSEHKRVCRRKR